MLEVARVVIFRADRLLVIHRFRGDEEFFVLPGGTIEEGETAEEAAVREAKEETDLDVMVRERLWNADREWNGRQQRTVFFLVDASDGTPRFVSGPEVENMSDSNRFVLEWHRLEDLKGKTMYPDGTYERLVERFGK